MENKTTVLEWAKRFESAKSDEIKKKMMEQLVTRTYAPIMEKVLMCDLMASKSIETDSKTGRKYLNINLSRINYIAVLISLYTNLEYDKNEDGVPRAAECYDTIKSLGIDSFLEEILGEEETQELLSVNGNSLDMIYEKECSTTSYIINKIDGLLSIANSDGYKEHINEDGFLKGLDAFLAQLDS